MVTPPQPSQQLDDARRAAFARGRLALGADRAGVRDELVGDLALLVASSRARTAASPRSATSVS